MYNIFITITTTAWFFYKRRYPNTSQSKSAWLQLAENIIYDKLLNDKLSTNLGYVYENVIAQILRATGKNLFYHTIPYAEGKKYYEIDFVIPDKHKISPIEVKSSGYKAHKSLDQFCAKYSDGIMDTRSIWWQFQYGFTKLIFFS